MVELVDEMLKENLYLGEEKNPAHNNVYLSIAARDQNTIQYLGKQSVLRSIQF